MSAGKKEKAAEPRTGRPSKVDKAAREEAPPAVRDKVSRGKKADKGKETGSGGAPVSKTAQAVKPGKAAPVKEAAVPPPEINLPPTPDVPPRPVEEGKIIYLKMTELHPFHTFREHPYKVQDDKGKDGQAILLVRPMYCSISEFIETFLLFCVRYTSYDIQAGVVIFLPTENIQIFRKVQFQIAVNECLLLTEVRQNYQLPTTEIPCYFFHFPQSKTYIQ